MKKQSWIKLIFGKYFGYTLILSLLFISLLIIYFGSTSYQCHKFPEKCVCEYKNENLGCEFRLKTQSELDIDDCNNNPREDEKCKCIEYKNDINKPMNGYACPNSCKNITIKDCHVRGLYSYNEEIQIEGYIVYGDYCETKLSYNQPITNFRNVSIYFTERNITDCEQCWNYKQICVKSHPKTE